MKERLSSSVEIIFLVLKSELYIKVPFIQWILLFCLKRQRLLCVSYACKGLLAWVKGYYYSIE